MATNPNRINNKTVFAEVTTFEKAAAFPVESIAHATIDADATNPMDAEKVEREFQIGHESAIGSAVTAWSLIKHIAKAAGEIISFSVVAETAPTGDNTLTLDVEVWTGSAWSSLLDADEVLDSGYTANTPQEVTLASSVTYAADDLVRITGALGGSTGNHAEGVRVQATLREKPQ